MTEKREKPLRLDMSFEEALARLSATRSDELQDAVRIGRQAKMEPKQGRATARSLPNVGLPSRLHA